MSDFGNGALKNDGKQSHCMRRKGDINQFTEHDSTCAHHPGTSAFDSIHDQGIFRKSLVEVNLSNQLQQQKQQQHWSCPRTRTCTTNYKCISYDAALPN